MRRALVLAAGLVLAVGLPATGLGYGGLSVNLESWRGGIFELAVDAGVGAG